MWRFKVFESTNDWVYQLSQDTRLESYGHTWNWHWSSHGSNWRHDHVSVVNVIINQKNKDQKIKLNLFLNIKTWDLSFSFELVLWLVVLSNQHLVVSFQNLAIVVHAFLMWCNHVLLRIITLIILWDAVVYTQSWFVLVALVKLQMKEKNRPVITDILLILLPPRKLINCGYLWMNEK